MTALARLRAGLQLALDALREIDEPVAPDPDAELSAWYEARAAALVKAGAYSSREDDLRAALGAGLHASHSTIRALRARFAPAAWTTPGRRSTARSGSRTPG